MNEEPIRIALAGASGCMGGELVRLIASRPDRYRLVAAWVGAESAALGRNAGELAGVGSTGCVCSTVSTIQGGADVVIDFSVPAALGDVVEAAVALEAAWVGGVTGLGDNNVDATLDRAAQRIPLLHADNFSLGIAVLAELAAIAKERLGPVFDIEIDEMHHRAKRDAPSGTARMLGRALGDRASRIRTEPRGDGEIGYSVRRGGGVCGEHTVYFLGLHERLELVHHANDRALFAEGALKAADWLMGEPAGRYTLSDLLTRHRAEGDRD